MRIFILVLLLLLTPSKLYSQAVWNGRYYNHPVCSNFNCQMCNNIRMQLSRNVVIQPVYTQPIVNLNYIDELVPTPEKYIDTVLKLLELDDDSVFIEPGCGDGRLLSKTSEICLSVGIELNRNTAITARKNAPKAIIIHGDALEHSYDFATHVYMYLYPSLMDEIIKKLKDGTKVISYLHKTDTLKWEEFSEGSDKFYIGVKNGQ